MDWTNHNLEQSGSILRPLAWKQYDWLNAGFSMRAAGNLSYRHGEDQEVLGARQKLSASMGLALGQWITMQQVHGNNVELAGTEDVGKGALRFETGFPETDGQVNEAPGSISIALVADCVPLLLMDPATRLVAVLHAGRKGTELEIATKGVEAMMARGSKAADIQAVIGPSIGPCHYEVDIWGENEKQLRQAGVSTVIRTDVCTAENLEWFFSHRAEAGDTGRFAGFIGRRA